MAELVGQSHHYADLLFAMGVRGDGGPTQVGAIRARRAGIGDCVDTEDMLRDQLHALADRRIIPRP